MTRQDDWSKVRDEDLMVYVDYALRVLVDEGSYRTVHAVKELIRRYQRSKGWEFNG